MNRRGMRADRLGLRFWADSALAATSALLFVLTLLWQEWIELVFRIDPDGGSGAAEWLIVAITATAALVSSTLAALEWRRAHAV